MELELVESGGSDSDGQQGELFASGASETDPEVVGE